MRVHSSFIIIFLSIGMAVVSGSFFGTLLMGLFCYKLGFEESQSVTMMGAAHQMSGINPIQETPPPIQVSPSDVTQCAEHLTRAILNSTGSPT